MKKINFQTTPSRFASHPFKNLKGNVMAFCLLLFCFLPFALNAQATIGKDQAPKPFSALEIYSNYKDGAFGGLRMPQLTTSQRNELSNAYGTEQEFKGLMIYNTSIECMEYWNGIKWISLCADSFFDAFTDEGIVFNGIKWATRNVATPGTFTVKPEDPGMFYQWGSKVGWSSSYPLKASDGINTWRDLSETGDVWLPENDPCPIGWRVPTKEEFGTLSSIGLTYGKSNGVTGLSFGSGEPILFLPAVGYRRSDNGSLGSVGTDGGYWSSTPIGTSTYYLYFASSIVSPSSNNYRTGGFSIRCVVEL
jgi:uncharacterized protein (TIGR02145 family)